MMMTQAYTKAAYFVHETSGYQWTHGSGRWEKWIVAERQILERRQLANVTRNVSNTIAREVEMPQT